MDSKTPVHPQKGESQFVKLISQESCARIHENFKHKKSMFLNFNHM